MVSFSNIFYSVCEQLMMVSSAYLTLTPLVAAEWISRRTRVTFMLLVAAMGVTCGVMYEVLPESKLPLFILTSVVSIGVLIAVTRIRPYFLLYLFFTSEFFVYSLSTFARVADALMYPESLAASHYTWFGEIVLWSSLVLFCAASYSLFHDRIPYILENGVMGQSGRSFWHNAWLLPFMCYLVDVLAIDVPSDPSLVDGNVLFALVFLQLVIMTLYLSILGLEYYLMHSAKDAQEGLNREHLLDMQLRQNAVMKERIDQARRARHDLRHFRNTVAMYLRNDDPDGLKTYLGQLDEITDDSPLIWCENSIVNAIVGHYVSRAQALGAEVQVHAQVPQECGITEAQFSVVVGNVLENAVAALERAKEEGGIRLALIIAIDVGVGRQFTLDVRNTYAGEILKNGQGELLSTKHEGTGVGTASVTAVAERMGGFARFGNEGGMFRAYVLMPLG